MVDKIAGLYLFLLSLSKKLSISVSEGLGITLAFLCATGKSFTWESSFPIDSIFWSSYFFFVLGDLKSISLMGQYGTFSRAGGSIQYAFSSVTVFELRILTAHST